MNMMTRDVYQLFSKTKGQLFFKKGAGFLGPLLGKVNVEMENIPAGLEVAISNDTLYYSKEAFLKDDEDTRVTTLAHELLHNAFLHGARRGNRCPDIWNIAGDHVINLWLKEHGFYMGGFPWVMDDRFKGMSTDEVYDILIQEGAAKPQPGSQQAGRHGDVQDFQGEPDKVQKAVLDVASAKSAAVISNKAGDVPGETTLVLEEFLDPELPWEVLFARFFNEMSNQEYSYRRPNRRYEDPILRGPTGSNGLEHLVYFLDISGSVTDEQILQFNSEVKYIQEDLEPERLTLITFDTKIHDVFEFERDEPFTKIEVVGRGGTDLKEPFEYIKKHRPTAAAIFTDLYVDIPPDPKIPIVWVISGNPGAQAPFGTTVHFKEKER